MQTDNIYTFGDSDRAAERLYWLARTFDAETLTFARSAVATPPACCVDLGAGPGFLTRSLHAGLACTRTVGLEASARFVAFGRADLPHGIELLEHDVLEPLPVQADVMVSRFLLTHLANPRRALEVWYASAPAQLLLEELALMSSTLPVLQQYYELVALVQQAAGQDMKLGRYLGELAEQAGWSVERHAIDRIAIPVAIMARLHALNLPTLRQQPVVAAHYRPDVLDAMQSALAQLTAGTSDDVVHVDMARCLARP